MYPTYVLGAKDVTESTDASTDTGSITGDAGADVTSSGLTPASQSLRRATSSATTETSATDASSEHSIVAIRSSSSATRSVLSSPAETTKTTAQGKPTSLSHGAIAGIAVGSVVGLVVLVLLLLWALVHVKCLRPKPPAPVKLDELRVREPQVAGDAISGLRDIQPADSISQNGLRSDSSTVVSPTSAVENFSPGEQRHGNPSPIYLPPLQPPSTSTWESSIPPLRSGSSLPRRMNRNT